MKLSSLIATVALVATGATFAQTTDHSAHHAPAASTAAAPATDGEVRKVDKEQGKVTLKHGGVDETRIVRFHAGFEGPIPTKYPNRYLKR